MVRRTSRRFVRRRNGTLVVFVTAAAIAGSAMTGGITSASAATRALAAPRPGAKPAPVAARQLRVVPEVPVPAGDEIVTGRGDSAGWHLYAASAGDSWQWQPLATLLPGGDGLGGQRWTGRQCITGDGRHVVAVVAPWSANNTPSGMDRGGIAYIIDAHTGVATPLLAGVSLFYFSPSCGPGTEVALTGYAGSDEQASELVRADAAAAAMPEVEQVPGEITGAAPAPGDGFFAARGNAIVRVSRRGEQVVARVPGQPFDLVANAAGGVDFLVGTGHSRATVWHLDARSARQVGTGQFGGLALFPGRGGHTVAAGVTSLDASAGMRALCCAGGLAEAASLDGGAASPAPAASRLSSGSGSAGALPQAPLLIATNATSKPAAGAPGAGASQRSWTPATAAPATTAFPRLFLENGALVAAPDPAAPARAAAGFTSTCAVPRNQVELQAMQPSPADAAWAANLAGRSLLSGSHARPIGFANLTLPPYSPSLDFPLPAPFGPGGQAIPREVLEGIFAQESCKRRWQWTTRKTPPRRHRSWRRNGTS